MNLEFLKNKVFFYYEVIFTLQLCVPSVANIGFFTCPAILTGLNLVENSGWLMSPYT